MPRTKPRNYPEALNYITELERALEYAYRVVSYGFEYSSFDFSVLKDRAKIYIEEVERTDAQPK